MKLLKISLVFLLFLLALRLGFAYHNRHIYTDGEVVTVTTRLLSDPQVSGFYQRFTMTLDGQNMMVTVPLDPEFHYGDLVRLAGKVSSKKGDTGTIYSLSFPKITRQNEVIVWFAPLQFLRQHIISLYEKSLPKDFSSLLLGIVFGIKEPMSKDFQTSLKQAGVLHVIAASGMNVTMVGGFLFGFFGIFFKRQKALVASITGIWLYALFSGLQASIIRASIMGSLLFVAQILGRQVLAWYFLLLAGACMLLLNPFLLLDAGFQLSFAATAGLLFIPPLFNRSQKAQKMIEKSLIGGDLVTTLAAQLATLPIIFWHFGSYSLVSILVNTLVLWTVPLLMVIGGLGAFVGLLLPFLGRLILFISIPFLSYFSWIVTSFGKSTQEFSLPILVGIGYYLILIAVVLYLSQKRDG